MKKIVEGCDMKHYRIALAIVALIVLPHFSSEESVTSKHLKINYTGKINGTEVEHIAISGLNQAIRFYTLPARQDVDPSHEYDEKDLDAIESIAPASNSSIRKFNGKDYVQIIVTSKSGKRSDYLVETTRNITGIEKDGSTKKVVLFDSLKSVEIDPLACAKKD